jgi:hypothetical protein
LIGRRQASLAGAAIHAKSQTTCPMAGSGFGRGGAKRHIERAGGLV